MRGMDGGSELQDDFGEGSSDFNSHELIELLKVNLEAHADTPFVRSLLRLMKNDHNLDDHSDFSDHQILRGEDLVRSKSHERSIGPQDLRLKTRIEKLQEQVESFDLEPERNAPAKPSFEELHAFKHQYDSMALLPGRAVDLRDYGVDTDHGY